MSIPFEGMTDAEVAALTAKHFGRVIFQHDAMRVRLVDDGEPEWVAVDALELDGEWHLIAEMKSVAALQMGNEVIAAVTNRLLGMR